MIVIRYIFHRYSLLFHPSLRSSFTLCTVFSLFYIQTFLSCLVPRFAHDHPNTAVPSLDLCEQFPYLSPYQPQSLLNLVSQPPYTYQLSSQFRSLCFMGNTKRLLQYKTLAHYGWWPICQGTTRKTDLNHENMVASWVSAIYPHYPLKVITIEANQSVNHSKPSSQQFLSTETTPLKNPCHPFLQFLHFVSDWPFMDIYALSGQQNYSHRLTPFGHFFYQFL